MAKFLSLSRGLRNVSKTKRVFQIISFLIVLMSLVLMAESSPSVSKLGTFFLFSGLFLSVINFSGPSQNELQESYEELQKRAHEKTEELSALNLELQKYSRELRQANVRLRKLDEAKSNFMALASHELKTPLTAISGFLEVILCGRVGELSVKQYEFLNVVKDSVKRLTRLVNDLLDISEIELGHASMRMQPTDLGRLLKEEEMVFEVQAGSKEITLEESIDGTRVNVYCDADRIKEVLDNLFSNAIKYTPRGGTISVSLHHTGDWVELGIQDTGVGISEEDYEKIFEPFQHIKKSGLEGEKSTGLGLALVRKIIEAHGGQVRVQSKLGQGSVFNVILPVKKQTAEIPRL